MQEENFRLVKPNLGSVNDAVERHASNAKAGIRKKREERLKERRLGGSTNADLYVGITTLELVQKLQNNNDINMLRECLRRSDVDPYFAPSSMYNCRGPYLFPTTKSLQHLVDTYDLPCLINIAAHSETFTWCNRLLQCGIVNVIKQHPASEDLIFFMTNMCFDSEQVRDQMLPLLPGIVGLVERYPEACARLFCSLFNHSPAPPPESVKDFWQSIIYYPSQNVLRGVIWACRSPQYRKIIIDSGVIGLFLDSPDFWVNMSADDNYRAELIHKYNMIGHLYAALVHSDPHVREKGACGLRTLSLYPVAFEPIFKLIADILQQINMCADYSRIMKPLQYTLCNLIQNLPDRNAFILLVDLKVFYQLRCILVASSLGDHDLKRRALQAILTLMRIDERITRNGLEEHEMLDDINNIAVTSDNEADIQEMAEQIAGLDHRMAVEEEEE